MIELHLGAFVVGRSWMPLSKSDTWKVSDLYNALNDWHCAKVFQFLPRQILPINGEIRILSPGHPLDKLTRRLILGYRFWDNLIIPQIDKAVLKWLQFVAPSVVVRVWRLWIWFLSRLPRLSPGPWWWFPWRLLWCQFYPWRPIARDDLVLFRLGLSRIVFHKPSVLCHVHLIILPYKSTSVCRSSQRFERFGRTQMGRNTRPIPLRLLP